ncbi:MAG: 2-dehydropantoate 2-reductase, partial [Burkholderiales bacterium PBB4]
MNYVVVGAGAVGCYVGGRLSAAGHAVTLVGRPRILAQLRQHGLRITDLDGFDVLLSAERLELAEDLEASMFERPCTVLLCVKGGATVRAANELARMCPASTPVVSLQNGVENVARIRATAPVLHALAGMVPFNVVWPKDAHVHRGPTGDLYISRHPDTGA